MASSRSPRWEPRNGVGVVALVAGIVSVVFAFVPIVGELVAAPTAVVALTCGWIGFVRADKGLATNPRDAVVGGALGMLSIFVMFLVFAATNSAPA
ncbi:hypothetical protein GCM10023319_78700 [Nocardia iowensis]|uniref:DUF4190 domain-containing protein n=1 Tax=Nocardia iowensis TaxID=204891 RepID=A0ABX8RXC3_NOCIO|nr:hypothetical protein KV110_15410 [Nocardia iowensis]